MPLMKVSHLNTIPLDLPLARPIKTAIHDMRSVGCVLVELETDQGITGQSYVFTLNAVQLQALHEMVLGFAHQVEGKNPHDVANINAAMWREMNPIGHAGFSIAALSAIDVACWDAIAKAANKPLAKMFGQCRECVKTYASGGLWLSQSIDECVREADEFIDAGFRAVKLRLGSQKIADDVARARGARGNWQRHRIATRRQSVLFG